MNDKFQLETYLTIFPNKLGIYLFDARSLKNLYKQEIKLNNINETIDFNTLKKFLDDNIFKIEKVGEKFIDNIFLIIENKKVFTLKLGIKKKSYNISNTKEYIKNSLIEAKDIFKENYQNQKIMHMIISKYIVNNKDYSSFEDNLQSDHLNLEIEFKSISKNIIDNLNKTLGNYQIRIIKYLDGNYIKNFFKEKIDISEMTYKILTGYNENEVLVIPRNPKKLAFFERFFQLFS